MNKLIFNFLFIFLINSECIASHNEIALERISENTHRFKLAGLNFFLEKVENDALEGWKNFAKDAGEYNNNIWAKATENKERDASAIKAYHTNIRDAIYMFSGHLSLKACSEYWVAYLSTEEDLSVIHSQKNIHIIMALTITSCVDFPLVKHMGIFRNPACKDACKNSAVRLHNFAAYAISQLYPAKKFMFSYPLRIMKGKLVNSFPKRTPYYCEGLHETLRKSPEKFNENCDPFAAIEKASQHHAQQFWMELGTPASLFIITLKDLAKFL